MQLRIGSLVYVRPSILDKTEIGDETVFRVIDIATEADIAEGCTVEGSIRVEMFDARWSMPRRLAVGPEGVIEAVLPPEPPPERRDALTSLTAREEDRLYRQRRDANLTGGEPLACVGVDRERAVYNTPHGPITRAAVLAYEGVAFVAVPEPARSALRWLDVMWRFECDRAPLMSISFLDP